MSKPKVSIVSISYNQEKYIAEALESFVAQQTDFDFEVIIADDCSIDRTAAIIREYAKTYPEIIKPIFGENNIGVQLNLIKALKAAQGQYIALCEGDDYWTDSTKLQKQAVFLDENPEYGLCFHPVKVLFENSEMKDFIYPVVTKESKFTLEGLLKENFIQTNSVMYRKQKYDNLPANILPMDWYLHLFHAKSGKIGFINTVMSVYRRHSGGIWWDSYNNKAEFWAKHAPYHLAVYEELLKLYPKPRHKKIILESVFRVFDDFVEIDMKYNKELLKIALQFPEQAAGYMTHKFLELQKVIKLLNNEKKDRKKEVDSLQKAVHLKENHIQNLEREIQTIKNSRSWKIFQKAQSINAKIKRS